MCLHGTRFGVLRVRRSSIEVSHLGKHVSGPPRRPYRAAVEGGTVPQFVGISVIIEGVRPTHHKHQSRTHMFVPVESRSIPRGDIGASEKIRWTFIVARLVCVLVLAAGWQAL